MLRSHLRQARAKSSTHSDLRDLGQGDLSPERVEALADLSVTDASIMREHWPEIEVERRYHLIRHMIELMQTDVSKDFERALCVAASDPDVQNRRTAIRGLAEANSGRTVSTIVELLERELDESVIRQILETLGEIAQNARLSEEQIDSMRTAMVHQAEHGSSAVIRREALTAASALPADQLLHDLVSAAYRSSNEADQVFAVRAMGRIGVSYW
ncbi:MAG: HEAT repeat domain-containing protein, partial [Chloroflexota bacterium]